MLRLAARLLSAFLFLAAGAFMAPRSSSETAPPAFAPALALAPAHASAGVAGLAADTLSGLLPGQALARVHAPAGLDLWECPAVREAREAAEELGLMAELEQVRGAILLATGRDPADTLRLLLGGELAAGVYEVTSDTEPSDARPAGARRPRAVLVLSRTADAEGCRLALGALLALARGEHDVKSLRYRDREYARIDRKLLLAAVDGVLVAASDDELLRSALDRLLDGTAPQAAVTPATATVPSPAPATANWPSPSTSTSTAPPDADAVAADGAPGETALATFSFDLERLQSSELRAVQQPGRRLLGKRVANPLANLLFGGLTLGGGRIDGALLSRADALVLRAHLPAPPADAPAAWFPPGAEGFAVPTSGQTLAVLCARRDLADWWRQRETLMSEDSQPGLAQADQNIGVLFAGASPEEDVFGRVAPELALVIDRQPFGDGAAAPEVRLPAFCLVGRVRGQSDFAGTLGVAFQSFVSFLNTDRAQDGRPPFLIDVQVHEGAVVRLARLLPPAGESEATLGMEANWSPAVAVAGDWLLVGSSAEQVRQLISAVHAGRTQPVGGSLGLDVNVPAALALAGEDRAALVANRMLEQGADAPSAGRDVDNLLRLAARLARVRADLRRDAHGLLFEFTLSLAGGAPAPDAAPGNSAGRPAEPHDATPRAR